MQIFNNIYNLNEAMIIIHWILLTENYNIDLTNSPLRIHCYTLQQNNEKRYKMWEWAYIVHSIKEAFGVEKITHSLLFSFVEKCFRYELFNRSNGWIFMLTQNSPKTKSHQSICLYNECVYISYHWLIYIYMLYICYCICSSVSINDG